MGKHKVKKNPGKKGKGKGEVSGGEVVKENTSFQDVKKNTSLKDVKENTSLKDVKENTAFKDVKENTNKLSEMVSAGTRAEVTVLVGKSVEVFSNNNNIIISTSKEDEIKGENCGEGKNRESINWQPREQGPRGSADEKERSQVDEKELKLEDSLEGNKLDCSEVSKLKDISDFSDSSGFQEMSSSLLEKQESQLMSSENGSGMNYSLLENSNVSFGPNDDFNQGFIDHSFEEKKMEAQGVQQRRGKKSKAPKQQSYPTIDAFVKAGVPRWIATMKHPLQNTWTFWYQKLDPRLSWEAQAQIVVDVATVEDFWQVYHHLEPACNLREGQDYLLFKKGICPNWSDPLNKQGGRLIVNMRREEGGQSREEVLARKNRLETMWVELLLVLIGEQAGAEAALINGAAVNPKKKADRLAVWLKEASNMEAVISVGKLVKERLQLEAGSKQVYFQAHDHGCLDIPKKRNNSNYNPSPAKTFI